MASSNIKLFDENKGNMLTDTEFNISTQRLNGLQTGIASSQLQNKAMYQVSLVAYAIAQVMLQNGKNANDTDAVSTFVANLSGTMLQKVYDIATTEEAQAGVATGKWMSPALVKAAIDTLAAKSQNILADATKTLYGLSSTAVPDDVFQNVAAQLQTMKTDIKKAAIFDVNDPTKTGWTYLTAGTVASNKVTFDATTITVDHAIMQCMVLMRVNSLTNTGTGDLVLSLGGGVTDTGFYKLRGNNIIRDKAFPILLDATSRCPSYGTLVSYFKSLGEDGYGGFGFSARITQTYNKDQNNFSVEYEGMNTLWWVNASGSTGGVLGDKDYSIEIYIR